MTAYFTHFLIQISNEQRKKIRKVLILALLGFGLFLLVLNCFNAQKVGVGIRFQKYAILSIFLGFIGFVFYLFKLKKGKLLSIFVIFSISASILMSSYNSYSIFQSYKYFSICAEYDELSNCAEMKGRFISDLENESLKYFSYGIGFDIKHARKLKHKYKIVTIHEGCMVFGPKICYNAYLNEHLITNFNDSIINF